MKRSVGSHACVYGGATHVFGIQRHSISISTISARNAILPVLDRADKSKQCIKSYSKRARRRLFPADAARVAVLHLMKLCSTTLPCPTVYRYSDYLAAEGWLIASA
jgi:hypothetical protein